MARSIEALMRAADIAMYRAKSNGGGQHCLFDAELAAEHQQKIDTEKALTEAVQRGEFLLAFQPQMSLVTGEVCGAEALLRWNHPRDGMRLPGTFIPIAEKTGVIAEIGDWVLGEVAGVLGDWQPERLRRGGWRSTSARARSIAPISSSSCARLSPMPTCRCRWSSSSSPRARQWKSARQCSPRSRRCAMMALRIAIDDFGTGYSNIARLRSMPLDRVKLDPSLIADIETSEKARVVVQAVIQLIKGVGCEVVAEAVETVAQADILRAMGCDTVQGYVFAAADVRGRVPRLDRQRRPRREVGRLSSAPSEPPVRRCATRR